MTRATDQRLDRLFPALTAKERGILVLRAYKEHRDEDPEIRNCMPSDQTREFARYIRMMNAANGEIGSLILILREQVKQIALRHAWLQSTLLHARDASFFGTFLEALKPPITESEVRKRRLPRVTDYAVFRDDDADEVELLRKSRKQLRALLDHAPQPIDPPVDVEAIWAGERDQYGTDLPAALVAGIVDGITGLHPQLRAVRSQVDEATAEFDGEDVLTPYVRGALDSADADLLELKANVEPLVDGLTLPEPTEVMRGHVRTIFERGLDG